MGRQRLSSSDSTDTTASNSPSKSNTTGSGGGGGMHQRNAANARERARMRVLSKAFIKLKTHLPWVPHDTKLSKLDTLRLATSYILHLTQVLDNDDTPMPPITTPTTTTSLTLQPPNSFSWPYSSCHRASSLCGMSSKQTSSSITSGNCYPMISATEFDFRVQSEMMNEHDDEMPEEKPHLC